MILRDRKIKHTPLHLVPLCEENKDEYLEIYNDAFKEVPHGATLTEKDIDEQIEITDDNNHFFIVGTDNKGIGFLQCKIEGNAGEFDMGLREFYRGKGYGKRLLETAIDFLNLKNVDEIYLTIITKNTLAYNIYKKRGFKEFKLLSDWFVLNN
nr:GNAT family N-acetyltransferase [Tissierella simiarum]